MDGQDETAPERRAHDGSAAGVAGSRSAHLGGYELLGELGRGAGTVVWRVRRTDVDGDLALKTLRARPEEPELPGLVRAFRREGALLGTVGAPAVPEVHEVGTADGRPYLVMELVEGRSLDQLLCETALDEDQVVAIGVDVARALAQAHQAGLVHRDVKPQNLIVSDGRARLIDLGLATRDGAVQAEQAAGTFAYSAPEQTGMLARPVDARADLYALGVVLFECAAGRAPFAAEDVGELLRQHAMEPAPDLSEVRPGLSGGLAAVVARLLAKDPDDRYQSAEELLATLLRTQGPTLSSSGEAVGRPLVGRDTELERLGSGWRAACAGRGGVVTVQGPTGVGKTTLVRELFRRVRADGGLVLAGRCSDGDGAAFTPLREALDRAVTLWSTRATAADERRLDHLRRAAAATGGLLAAVSSRLGALVDAPRLPDGDHQAQVVSAVVDLLVELARQESGLLLSIADASSLDAMTARVVAQLSARAHDEPLLLVLTARDVVPGDDDLLDGALGPPPEVIDLRGLTPAGVEELVASKLGTSELPPTLVERLAVRTSGSPFAVLEYLRALLDAGALWPAWGRWELLEDELDRLDLPSDVVGLVTSRLDRLPAPARRLLAGAAVQGSPFEVALVAAALDASPGEAAEAVTSAAELRLIEPRGGAYGFVHQEVPQALLAVVGDEQVAAMHHRVAEALAARGSDDPDAVLALARHRIRAGIERVPAATAEACARAGRQELHQQAPAEAVWLLSQAATAVRHTGASPDVRLRHDLAIALLRSGDLAAAQRELDRALEQETDPVARAWLHHSVSATIAPSADGERMLATLRAGLAEIGRAWPSSSLVLLLTSLWRWVAGVAVDKASRGRGRLQGERRRRAEVEAALLGEAVQAAVLNLRDTLSALLILRSVLPVHQLGHTTWRPRTLAGLGFLASSLGLRRWRERAFVRARTEADERGDPAVIAHVAWVCAFAEAFDERGEALEETLRTHGRWLSVGDYVNGVAVLSMVWCAQGYAERAPAMLARGWARVPRDTWAPDAFALAFPSVHAHAQLGDLVEATRQLGKTREALRTQDHPTREQRFYAAWTGVNVLIEEGEVGPVLDLAIDELEAVELPTTNVLRAFSRRSIMLARLTQAQVAHGPERDRRRRQARAARRQLHVSRARLGLRAADQLGRAWERQLRGRNRAAERDLRRAERTLDRTDFPLLAHEASLLRARAVGATSRLAATRHARVALLLAEDHGWTRRARRVREEFDLDDARGRSRSPARSSTSAASPSGSGAEPLTERRLVALQQVSAAAASVLDPAELTRVVLDVIVGLLAAERAFLFLADTEDEEAPLVPYRGRDASGAELLELTGHSATLVQRVHEEGEPLVVTGSEEGAALGSESAVVHGLRSILVAPLQLKGRRLGVVYLDSRVAKGIFSEDDVLVLAAMTNHVAAALETARAARLEVAVRTEREQRHLAETLRASVSALTATLDGDEVLDRLLRLVTAAVPGERACLLREGPGRLELVGACGVDMPSPAPSFVVGDHPGLAELVDADGPSVGGTHRLQRRLPEAVLRLLDSPRSWLAVPVAARGRCVGLVIVSSPEPEAYGRVAVDVAASLAEQGALAHDNARLFAKVQALASTDELTSLPNRRHLWEQAGRHVAVAAGGGRRLAAMMLDIDHFKAVNDSHGHAVGDEVLKVVASRLARQLRDQDLLGRYGGEEFAALLPDSNDPVGLAERLRRAVASNPVAVAGATVWVTISIGVAELGPTDDLDTLLARADAALYRAKTAGRNQVTSA